MKKKEFGLVLVFILLFTMNPVHSQQTLAFPGAEGYGKYATGGRGGRVIEVTNLKDQSRQGLTIEGSLRAALETEGTYPITIVFRVSGIIELDAELKSSRSNVTIAGQTAPGDGICIKDQSVKLSGENLIIRYIRFRPGDEEKAETSGLNIENSENFIVDHCSMSWSVEENTGFYDNVNSTIQWCIISEGLYNSYHEKGARGYGGQWGGQYTSYHHNLIAHNNSRSPRVNGARSNDTIALTDIRNNIIFNWGTSGAVYGGEIEIDDENAVCQTNLVNNYYKPGPGTSSDWYFCRPTYVTDGNSSFGFGQWYISGNVMYGDDDLTSDNWEGVKLDVIEENEGTIDSVKSTTEFDVSEITTFTASEAYDTVLAYAGAVRPIRDSVDIRVVSEVKGEIDVVGGDTKGAGSGIIDSQKEVGGWPEYNTPSEDKIPADTDGDGMPDEWEEENNLDPSDSTDGSTITDDGYSNLEHYLNSDISYINTNESTSSVDEISNDGIALFPTLVETTFTVTAEQKIKELIITGIDGKAYESYQVNNNEKQVDVQHLDSGVYYIQIMTSDNNIITKGIIKL